MPRCLHLLNPTDTFCPSLAWPPRHALLFTLSLLPLPPGLPARGVLPPPLAPPLPSEELNSDSFLNVSFGLEFHPQDPTVC